MAYALITGASKGIGKEIAKELSKRQYDLVLVARSENLIADLAKEMNANYGVKAVYVATDLSAENAAETLLNFLQQNEISISVLVNNAGYGLWGAFEKLSLEEQINMLRLNDETLVRITHKLLPSLHKAKKAYILNIASTTAYQAIPYLSVYAASKAFVVAFSRGLAAELSDTNVSVTCVSPGGTDTNFMERAGIDKAEIVKAASKVSMSPEDVAKQAVEALFAGKTEFIPGAINKIQVGANNFLPKKLIEKIAGNLYKP
ncbi:MAG TPA: SDR family oxidoreductase [Chitinophagales bacterium]